MNIYGLTLAAVLGAAVPLAHARDAQIDKKVDALMAQMTLDEKIGQLHQIAATDLTGPASAESANRDKLADIRAGKVGSVLSIRGAALTRRFQELALQSRLKIPMLFALDVIHGYQTVFPVPLAEAASWDLAAIEGSARIAATEAAAGGIHWTFAPMVDIARDPRWGRVMEGAGEDTYLGAQIARARVRGFQGKRLGDLDAVMATAKHFAAYGAALAGRDYNSVDMSLQQLNEVYLPPFKAALDAGVATFMNSFNTLNGVPATANRYLLQDVLRKRWNFDGVVVSDWASVAELVAHGYAADLEDAGVKAITAGNDIDMEGYAYTGHLAHAVEQGRVPVSRVDAAVRRVLYRKFELGLFDDPFRFSDPAREKRVLSDPSHRVAALEMARKSMVLLKNEAHTLPLAAGVRRIAVIGPLAEARRDLEGAWIVQSSPEQVVSIAAGVESHAPPGASVRVARGCDVACTGDAGFAQALALARQSDVVVLALGEDFDQTGEARSRADIGLPGMQERLFEQIKALGKPVVAVIVAGRPLVFNSVADKADAIVYAWIPGTEGGDAVADVLFGRVNPSAKLPITFPRSVGQIPIYYSHLSTGRPQTAIASEYRTRYVDMPNTPRYAFGHGLSYTEFIYARPRLSSATLRGDDKVSLSFTLTNNGKVAGDEVVQLYIHDLVASVARPVKLLKGFHKVHLAPGESAQVSFTIGREMLSFYDSELKWGAEPGAFDLMLGSASDDIRQTVRLELLQ